MLMEQEGMGIGLRFSEVDRKYNGKEMVVEDHPETIWKGLVGSWKTVLKTQRCKMSTSSATHACLSHSQLCAAQIRLHLERKCGFAWFVF